MLRRATGLIFRSWKSAIGIAVVGTLVRMGSHIVLLPLLLIHLSSFELALWWVFIALGNVANLADFGFGNTISRIYSYLWAGAESFEPEGITPAATGSSPNYRGLQQLNSTLRFLYLWMAIGTGALLAVGGTLFLGTQLYHRPDSAVLWASWGVYVLTISFGFYTSQWLLAAAGVNQVRAVHTAHVWSSLTYLITTASFLLSGFGLASIVLGVTVRAIVIRVVARRAYLKVVPREGTGGIVKDLAVLRRLWPNARKMAVLSIGAYLLANGNVLICSRFLGEETTASFGLTNQIGGFLVSFSALWLAVKWPEITILRTQGQLHRMAVLFTRRLALVCVTYVVLAGLVVLFGNYLLALKGTAATLLDLPYLVVFLFYLGHQLVYVQFGTLIVTENVVPFFRVGLLTGLGMFLLSLILTPALGLWGLIIAPLVAECAYSGWFTICRGFQGQPLTVRQFLRNFVNPFSDFFSARQPV
jgi:O-antigen/teichoic acid export membrane protein